MQANERQAEAGKVTAYYEGKARPYTSWLLEVLAEIGYLALAIKTRNDFKTRIQVYRLAELFNLIADQAQKGVDGFE